MTKRLFTWADTHLIDDWRNQWKRLWSMRVAMFWLVVGGVVALAPMVSEWAQGIIGPGVFSAVFLLAFVSFGAARLLKQPGASGDE